MARVVQQGQTRPAYVTQFVANNKASLDEEDPKKYLPGSEAYVIQTGTTYILGEDQKWYKKVCCGSSGGGDSGGGSTSIAISAEDGNILQELPDGYYVPEYELKISKDSGNVFEQRADGLFSPSVELQKDELIPIVEKVIEDSMEQEDIDFSTFY